MDAAEYFMPGFRAKSYSPQQDQGGFWVGVRNEARERHQAGGGKTAARGDKAKPRRKRKKGDKARSTVAAGGGVLDVHAADEPPTNSHEVVGDAHVVSATPGVPEDAVEVPADEDDDQGYDDETDDPDLTIVRALRRAIVTAASAAEDGSDGNYEAALEAFIGPGTSVCSSEQFAALLRPLAMHWGGSAAKMVASDTDAPRRVARLVAAGANGAITSAALRLFVEETHPDHDASVLAEVGEGEEVLVDGDEAGLLYREMQRIDDECFCLFTIRKKAESASGATLQVSALKYPSEDFLTMNHSVESWSEDPDAQRELARELLKRVSFSETGGLLVGGA